MPDTDTPGAGLRRADRYDHTMPVKANVWHEGGVELTPSDDGEISFYLHWREQRGRIQAICEMSTSLYRLLKGDGEPQSDLDTLVKIGPSYRRRRHGYVQDVAGRFDNLDEAVEKALSNVATRIKLLLNEHARDQRRPEKIHRLTQGEATSSEEVLKGAQKHYGTPHPSPMQRRDYRERGNSAGIGAYR